VPEVAKFIAELKGISVEQVAEQTSQNFYTLFKDAKRGA
jgi:TatD DNase family protein